MQKIFNRYGLHFNVFVFPVSAGLIALFLFFGVAFPEQTGDIAGLVQDGLATYLGWFYILAVGGFLFFSIWLYFSPYGRIRLGPDDAKPDFSRLSWFAMLFSAGMGIGLIFWSVAEPVTHFANPPFSEPGTVEAARDAMQFTFFHWGLHAWGIYIVIGLALAYFTHRKNKPLSIRSALEPIFGERIHGLIGDVIDTFAVLGTLFGIATSLGLGVMQVNAGLHYIGVLDLSLENQLLLIAIITFAATISVVSGLERGILWLSNMNIALGTILLLFVFLAGPTIFLLKSFVQNTGDYTQRLITSTFWNAAYQDSNWQKSWTIFYWAWWISWSPFVGIFIARISRGRTIREFVLGVLLAPTLLTFFWLSVFGNTAIHMDLFEGGVISAVSETAPGMPSDAVIANAESTAVFHDNAIAAILYEDYTNNVPRALYLMLERLPVNDVFISLASLLGTFVVASYFITSSDSGSLVIDIITAGGHHDPPVSQRIFWALLEGGVAATLLYTGGTKALEALQTASITTALPLTIILVLICWGLVRALRQDLRLSKRKESEKQ